jgi:hypothetical protein
MGRNSVEATKASLIRAARARLAALTAGLAGFLAALRVWPADFAVFLLFWAGFFFVVEEACPAGLVVEPPEDCPVSGSTIIKRESRTAKPREAWCKMEVREDATFISSL